nr:hypothetical protein [Actinoplanes digitatis]
MHPYAGGPLALAEQVHPQVFEGVREQLRPALVERRRVRPRTDHERRLLPGGAQPGVLVEGLFEGEVVPAADQAHRHGHPVRRRPGVGGGPEQIVLVRVVHPVLELLPPAAERPPVGVEQWHPTDGAPQVHGEPQHRAGVGGRAGGLVEERRAADQGEFEPEGALPAGVEALVEVVRRDLEDGGAPLGRRVQPEGPLHVAEVARADRRERAGEPLLLTQPLDRGLAVGGLVAPQVEGAARAAGAAGALHDHAEALRRESRAEQRVPGEAAPVRAAHEQHRAGLVGDRGVVVGEQRAAVGGGHLEARFPLDVEFRRRPRAALHQPKEKWQTFHHRPRSRTLY